MIRLFRYLFLLATFLFISFPSHSSDLDDLFDQLRSHTNPHAASRVSDSIWQEWRRSDNPTITLLSQWASDAISDREYSAALDILDQVVILAPSFSEGWNQRATVHYLNGDYGKSIADIERTLSLESRHYGALSGLASIQEILERDRDALDTWYRVLRIYPAMRSAQDSVIRLEEELSDEHRSL